MENRRALSSRRDMFLDERGAGLRVTWHPERDLVVLSVWQDASCVGTFRMAVEDVPRLSGLLAAALGDWVGQMGAGSGGHRRGVVGMAPGAGDAWPGPGDAWAGPGDAWPAAGDAWPGASGTRLGASDVSLSLRQRVRLSRPVLRLRGSWHGRRRSA